MIKCQHQEGAGIHGRVGRCPGGTSHDPLVLGSTETSQLEQELRAAK